MSEVTASELRSHLDDLGIDLGESSISGYSKLDRKLNLNAIAIGLGLENIEYAPEKFPGLIYHLDTPETTLLLFDDGTIAFTDAPSEESAEKATETAVKRLNELGLLTSDDLIDGITISEHIAVPPDVQLANSCPNCDEPLTGEESYCPNCGEKIEDRCPNCSYDLSGGENFCPDCGTEL